MESILISLKFLKPLYSFLSQSLFPNKFFNLMVFKSLILMILFSPPPGVHRALSSDKLRPGKNVKTFF